MRAGLIRGRPGHEETSPTRQRRRWQQSTSQQERWPFCTSGELVLPAVLSYSDGSAATHLRHRRLGDLNIARGALPPDKPRLWFSGGPALDKEARKQFAGEA